MSTHRCPSSPGHCADGGSQFKEAARTKAGRAAIKQQRKAKLADRDRNARKRPRTERELRLASGRYDPRVADGPAPDRPQRAAASAQRAACENDARNDVGSDVESDAAADESDSDAAADDSDWE